jgi:hypothetical protein
MEFELNVLGNKLKLEESKLKEGKKGPIKLKSLPRKKLTSKKILKTQKKATIVLGSQSPFAKGNIL